VVHLNKIVAINFFYGWTGLGWLLAGIWALTDEPFSDESEEEVVEPTDDVNGNPRVEPEW
jgi:hypothetical protein